MVVVSGIIDPLADVDSSFGKTDDTHSGAPHYHIRIQQRNGRKTLTTLQGLEKKYDGKKMLRELKKDLACNGVVIKDSELGQIIQLQGDHRNSLRDFLVSLDVDRSDITVHGF